MKLSTIFTLFMSAIVANVVHATPVEAQPRSAQVGCNGSCCSCQDIYNSCVIQTHAQDSAALNACYCGTMSKWASCAGCFPGATCAKTVRAAPVEVQPRSPQGATGTEDACYLAWEDCVHRGHHESSAGQNDCYCQVMNQDASCKELFSEWATCPAGGEVKE